MRDSNDLLAPAPAHPQRVPPIPSLAFAQILGCDLIYDADAVPNLAHTIAELLSANPSATALIAAPDRCEVVDELSEPFDEFRSPSCGVVSPVVLPGSSPRGDDTPDGPSAKMRASQLEAENPS